MYYIKINHNLVQKFNTTYYFLVQHKNKLEINMSKPY